MYQQISFVKPRWTSIDNITLINQQKYFLIGYEIKKHWTVEKGKENNILTLSTITQIYSQRRRKEGLKIQKGERKWQWKRKRGLLVLCIALSMEIDRWASLWQILTTNSITSTPKKRKNLCFTQSSILGKLSTCCRKRFGIRDFFETGKAN